MILVGVAFSGTARLPFGVLREAAKDGPKAPAAASTGVDPSRGEYDSVRTRNECVMKATYMRKTMTMSPSAKEVASSYASHAMVWGKWG